MLHAFSRTERLIGPEGIEKLKNSRVAVFGIGGVGTFVVEGLARSGVGHFLLVDDDCVCITNLNRQLHATRKTIGRPKVEAMRERILDINPDADVAVMRGFYLAGSSLEKLSEDPESASVTAKAIQWEDLLRFHEGGQPIDYIVDAIDTVSAKLDLIVNAQRAGIPVISSMGTGNKLDPTRLQVADIYETAFCPLARVMRQELRKRGVMAQKVVYSQEEPLVPREDDESRCCGNCDSPKAEVPTGHKRRAIPGSVAFVPSVAGLILAGEVVKDLLGYRR